MLYLCVDPGIRVSGAAVFGNGRLLGAAAVKNTFLSGNMAAECRAMARSISNWYCMKFNPIAHPVDKLLLEWPRMLPVAQQKGDQNDLPALAAVSACVATHFPFAEVESYYPRDWKGTVDPDVMTTRIHNRLTPEELAVVDWSSKSRDPKRGVMHNVFDAIGIGLHHAGRMKPTRAYELEAEKENENVR